MTTTNAFKNRPGWGGEVIEYKTDKGRRLQGRFTTPPATRRVNPDDRLLYERLSDSVHRYVPPSDRDYYNTSVFTTQGYFVFQPDIVFRPREPGLSVVECVTPGVKRVVQMGVVDAKRVGVVGHSWGGFDTAFLATPDVFSAAVAGAVIREPGQQLRQPSLDSRHRRDRSHRDGPAAHGGAALGRTSRPTCATQPCSTCRT